MFSKARILLVRINFYKIAVVCSLAVAVLLGCGRGNNSENSNSITIKGSDTMVHLASAWSEAFMAANSDYEVSVTGGGSGTGIAALLNGTTDICMASRKMKNKELDLARQKGMNLKEIVVALDGIAVIVNPANPVSELTVGQVGKIYKGAYETWGQVGAPKENIIVLARESSSGTYVFFQEHVLKKADYTQKARLMPATSSVIQSVSADNWAIGYVGLGYALDAKGKVKVLSIKENVAAKAVAPSSESVKSGEYSIARPLYLYIDDNASDTVKRFIDFCLSAKGQEIVKSSGYVTVN